MARGLCAQLPATPGTETRQHSGLSLAVIAWKQSQLQWSGAAAGRERTLNDLRPAGAPLHP